MKYSIKFLFLMLLISMIGWETVSAIEFPINPVPTMSSSLLLSDQSGQYVVAGNEFVWAYYVVGAVMFTLAFVEMIFAVFVGPYDTKERTVSAELLARTIAPATVIQSLVLIVIGMAIVNIVNGNFGPADQMTFHSGDMVIDGNVTTGSDQSYLSNGKPSTIIKHNWYPWNVQWEYITSSLIYVNVGYALYCRLNYYTMFIVFLTTYYQSQLLMLLHNSPLKRFWWMPGMLALLMEAVFMVTLKLKSQMEGGKMTWFISFSIFLYFAWIAIMAGVTGLAFSPYDQDNWFIYVIVGTALLQVAIWAEWFLVGKHGVLKDDSSSF